MTIRLTVDHWPDGDRAQAKRLGALTIEPLSAGSLSIELRDHTGRRQLDVIDGTSFNPAEPWSMVRDVLDKVQGV